MPKIKKIKKWIGNTWIGNKLRFYRGRAILRLHAIFSGIIPSKFLTWHLRPKYAKDIKSVSARVIPPNQLAIIIQGPVAKRNNFTVETIKLYRKIFNGAKIILSTWEDEDKKVILAAQDSGAEIILNKKPTQPGYNNLNLQLTTTKSALLRAKESGVQYSFKTRTDQRFYRYDLFDYFIALQKAFPLKEGTQCQHKRLITSSFATCKYRLCGITDFMMFGDTRDMLSYWGAPFYEEGIKPYVDPVTKQIPPIISGMVLISEIYLTVKYLERLGIKPDWTIQQYWGVLRDYFCVVDGYALDVYWDRYFKFTEYRYTRDYGDTNPRAMEFSDWLQLYIEGEGKWEGIRDLERWEYRNGNLEILRL